MVMPLRNDPYIVEHGRVEQKTILANSDDKGEITYEMELISECNYQNGQTVSVNGQIFKIIDNQGPCGGKNTGKYRHLLELF